MQGSVYAIRSHQTKNIYIGSTSQKLCNRMSGHRQHYKAYINGNPDYRTSYEILQYEDAYIELIELIEYNDKSELTAREGHYIRTMDCVNKKIEGRTQKEYRTDNKKKIQENTKIYRDTHKEESKEYNKQYCLDNKRFLNIVSADYYKNNKERAKQYRINNANKIKEQNAIKMTCECGSICNKRDKNNHLKTKKHIKFIQDFV